MSKVDPIVLTADTSKERVEEITDHLEQGITELFDSERYKEYLQVMSRFHNYSFNNTVLIAMQKPDATHIAGYNAWKNNFGRNVKKGEKGIRILAPSPYKIRQEVEKKDPETGKAVVGENGKPIMETKEIPIPAYKVVYVFDISQTEGRELPRISANELTEDVEKYEDFFAALEMTSPVPMGFEKIEGTAHGYYSQTDKRIAINEGMSQLQNLKTAIHEIAHAKLHDIDLNAPKEEQKTRPDRRTREVQAESIAYTVCQYYGLDTSDYSFGYVAGWSRGRELAELKASLETIRSTAAEIIDRIDGYFTEMQKERKAPDLASEPIVTIIKSEHIHFHDGETMSLSKANALIESLDQAAVSEDGYYKTKFRIDFVMDGQSDSYVGRQDLGDGDGTLIDHIEKYYTYYANNPDWDNYILRNENEGTEALEADKAQREMILHEFIPYLKLHNNLSKMEQNAIKALNKKGNMTPEGIAYHTAMKEFVFKCRTMINSGDYDLPPAPQLKDFDTELAAYREYVKEEIVQEATAAGMTVEEYAANGYEPPDKLSEKEERGDQNVKDFLENLSKNDREGMLKALRNASFDVKQANFTGNGNAVGSQEAILERGENKISVRFYNHWNPMQIVKPERAIKQKIEAVLYKNGNPMAICTLAEKKSMSLQNAERNYYEMLKQWKNLTKQEQITFDTKHSVLANLHKKQAEISGQRKRTGAKQHIKEVIRE